MKIISEIKRPEIVPHQNEEDSKDFDLLVASYDESWEDDNEDLQAEKDREYASQFEEDLLEEHRSSLGDYQHHKFMPLGTDYTYLKYTGDIENKCPTDWVKARLSDLSIEPVYGEELELQHDDTTVQIELDADEIYQLATYALINSKAVWSQTTKNLVTLFEQDYVVPGCGFVNSGDEYIKGPEYLIEFSRKDLDDILNDIKPYVDHSCCSFVHTMMKLCGWSKRYHPGMSQACGSEHSPVTDMIDRDGVVRFRMEWW